MTMRLTTKLCLSLLIAVFLNGCNQSHAGRDTQSNKPLTNLSNTNGESADDILFKGTNVTVIKAVQVDPPEVGFKKLGQSCLGEAEAAIKVKLSSLRLPGNTKYFELKTEQSYSSGPDKFVIKIRQDLFERIDLKSLKEIDEFAGDTLTRRMFVLTNPRVTKLLLIGQESATSGLGHLLKAHLLLSADSDSPPINFRSISDDPRKVGVSVSGTSYFSQIEPVDSDDTNESTAKSVRLKVSLFTVAKGSSSPNIATELTFNCSNVAEIF